MAVLENKTASIYELEYDTENGRIKKYTAGSLIKKIAFQKLIWAGKKNIVLQIRKDTFAHLSNWGFLFTPKDRLLSFMENTHYNEGWGICLAIGEKYIYDLDPAISFDRKLFSFSGKPTLKTIYGQMEKILMKNRGKKQKQGFGRVQGFKKLY
jgi:hypothetical protein